MPKTYIDDDGNEVELLTPEEQQAEIEKKVAELAAQKKEEESNEQKKEPEKKEDDDDKVPSLEDITKELSSLKENVEQQEKQKIDEWFEDTISPVLDEGDEETKKKVRQYFDLLRDSGKSNKEAMADALLLTTRKNISPLNGVTSYNKNSGVPGSKGEKDLVSKLSEKFKNNLPPGFKIENK